MFEALKYKLNQRYEGEYDIALENCEQMLEETQELSDSWQRYFHALGLKYKMSCQLIEDWTESFYLNHKIEELQALNKQLFSGVTSREYSTSFFNPVYAAAEFGEGMGKLAAGVAAMIQPLYHKALENQHFEVTLLGSMLFKLYQAKPEEAVWKEIISETMMRRDEDRSEYQQRRQYSPDHRPYLEIVELSDLTDLRYLYQYLHYIGPNEIETARFLNSYPQDKTNLLAKTLVDAYIKGFENDNKDYRQKNTVAIMYNIGQEQIVRKVIRMLKEYGLQSLISFVGSTKVNPQYNYDHRWDSAIYLTDEMVKQSISLFTESSARIADLLKGYSGGIYFDRFGEKLFSPEQKDECLKLDKEQQQLMKTLNINKSQIMDKYAPRSETSFCIIGFPLPEIGSQFTEIFENTAEINMLDSEHWETIQQKIIDVLDKADYVEVKGKGENLTDIRVQMQKLQEPVKQSNFCNCGADVNIPVGEVFTSPQLMGTNGVLHVTDIYLDDLHYDNLKLIFKDGFAKEYTCTNYEDAEKNHKYVFESLFLPHTELPLGEFAIGTNTLAYLMAKKFNILPQMPVLIIEKMGPHFAIGDTCFSWEEDKPVFNPDGKEITARDNDVSILRKTDINKAYTNKHTDITLPYEELAYITAVSESGERFDIIRDGRFVVPGTEELNEPLEELDRMK
ncbi:MAG: aminopeptidase [Candidatus Cloacimonetes bacterium]|nr:aminopeptidase [Candidatus Cloacimonadota bacterium]